MAKELAGFELRANAHGIEAGAFRTGTHDDLVIAVMLATLIDASTADVTYSPSPWS